MVHIKKIFKKINEETCSFHITKEWYNWDWTPQLWTSRFNCETVVGTLVLILGSELLKAGLCLTYLCVQTQLHRLLLNHFSHVRLCTVAAHKHVWHCITELPISSLWAQYEALPNYIRAAFGNPREGKGLPRHCNGKESTCQCRRWDSGLISGSGRSSGEGNGNSSILAWEIPWTEEPGGLQSMRSQRTGHDWESEQSRERKDHVFKDGRCGTPDAAQVPALWVSSHPSPPESFLP